MADTNAEKLLTDRRVVEEINRHLWLESEKAGHDIGFEKAKEDWLKNFSKAWMEYHMPEELTKANKTLQQNPVVEKASAVKEDPSFKKRRAKSYIQG